MTTFLIYLNALLLAVQGFLGVLGPLVTLGHTGSPEPMMRSETGAAGTAWVQLSLGASQPVNTPQPGLSGGIRGLMGIRAPGWLWCLHVGLRDSSLALAGAGRGWAGKFTGSQASSD